MPLDLALTNFDTESGRYNLAKGANGDVAFDATQAFAVMASAACRKLQYWADVNHGSRLYLLKDMTARTPSQAQAEMVDAQQPLVDQGLITNVQAIASSTVGVQSGNQLAVDVYWQTPGGASGSGSIGV